MGKNYSGFTSDTADNLLLDAGAFFVNYVVGTDTYESAKSGGKLLGATRGGGEFKASMTARQIEVDGVKGRAKGLEVNDAWEVYLKATVLEANKETIKKALASATVTTSTVSGYDEIEGNPDIAITDYVDNITWVGKLSGSQKPVIIQVFNALNTDGLTLAVADKGESTMAMTFYGHYDEDNLDNPPFKIWFPNA